MFLRCLILRGAIMMSAIASPLMSLSPASFSLVERSNIINDNSSLLGGQPVPLDRISKSGVRVRADRQRPANQQTPEDQRNPEDQELRDHYAGIGRVSINLMSTGGGLVPSANALRNAGWLRNPFNRPRDGLEHLRLIRGWNGVAGFPSYNSPITLDPRVWSQSRWAKGDPTRVNTPGYEFLVSRTHRAIVAMNGLQFGPPQASSTVGRWHHLAAQEYTSATPPRWIVFEGVQDTVETSALGIDADSTQGPFVATGESDCFPLGTYMHQVAMGFAPSIEVAQFLASQRARWGAQTVASVTVWNHSPGSVLTIAYAIRPLDATLTGYAQQNTARGYYPGDAEYPRPMNIAS